MTTTLPALDLSSTDAGRPMPKINSHQGTARMRKSAEDFEAMFISQMFKPMFEGISTDGPTGGGDGEKMFRSMLVDEYGKMLAHRGGFGIADAVMRTMIETQARQTP
ncbi:MAG: rod-binding protein [Alphaproteobacteria bacterium]